MAYFEGKQAVFHEKIVATLPLTRSVHHETAKTNDVPRLGSHAQWPVGWDGRLR